jgi:hypothetical protein
MIERIQASSWRLDGFDKKGGTAMMLYVELVIGTLVVGLAAALFARRRNENPVNWFLGAVGLHLLSILGITAYRRWRRKHGYTPSVWRGR